MTHSVSPTGFAARMTRWAGFSLVACYALFPTFPAPWFVATVAFLACWLLAGHYRQRWQAVRGLPVTWISIGLCAVVVLWSLHPNADHQYAGMVFRKYAKVLLIPITMSLLVEPVWRRRSMNAFVGAMLFILACVYIGIWLPLPWAVTQQTGWGITRTVVGDYITQGILMSFFVVLALDRGIAASRKAWRAVWWAVAALAVLSVTHLSQGRTGYLLLGIGVGSYVLFSLRGRTRWISLAVMVVLVAVTTLTSQAIRDRVELGLSEAQRSDTMEITSIGGRVNFWRITLQMVEQRPLTGWGTGSYHREFCAQVPERPDWCAFGNWHPHNQYLFFWMENGLPGVLFYAALVLAPLWAARRAPPGLRGLLVSFSAIFVFDSMINAAMWSARENHFFSYMAALLLAEAGFRGRVAQAVGPTDSNCSTQPSKA